MVMSTQNRVRLKQLRLEAEGYLELGMPQHALDVLARLGDPDRFAAPTAYLWGEALRELQRYGEAIAPLNKAVQAQPGNIQVWVALGWCHKRTGRIDLAIRALEEALAVDPTEALLHYNLACYWSLAGSKRRALGYLSQALVINPKYRDLIDDEPDFDPIRSDPEFQAVTSIIV